MLGGFNYASVSILSMTNDDYVRVKPDLLFPRTITGSSEPGKYQWVVNITAIWNGAKKCYDIDELNLRRHSDNPDESPVITSRSLRHLTIQEAFQDIVNREVRLEDGSAYVLPLNPEISVEGGKPMWVPNSDATVTVDIRSGKSKIEEERLREAGRIHAVARAFGQPPMKLVGEFFDISPTAVTRLMAKARERGFSE